MTFSTNEQTYPEAIVGALIFNGEGKLLLVRSHKWRGLYGLPGGHVELGETLEEALRREVKEETGLQVHTCDFLIFQEVVFDPSFWKERHFIFFEYVCHVDAGQVKLNDEADDFVWLDPAQALSLALDPYTERAVREYLRRDHEK